MTHLRDTPGVKTGITPKGMAVLFVCVAVLYLGVFHGIEHLRRHKGPWQVTFVTDAVGQPTLVINHPSLSVTNVRIIFAGVEASTSNQAEEMVFDRPLKPLPFGKRLHEDLVSMPGVETIALFGHEVELLPRVLKVNRRELPWKSNTTVTLAATNRLGEKTSTP